MTAWELKIEIERLVDQELIKRDAQVRWMSSEAVGTVEICDAGEDGLLWLYDEE